MAIITTLNVRYGPGVRLCDIYRPSAPDANGSIPIVLCHPGGWYTDNKTGIGNQASYLAGTGSPYLGKYAIVSVEFTQATDNDPSWAEAVEDIRAAIRWVREVAGTYNFRTDRVYVGGQSAGSNLAAWVHHCPESAEGTILLDSIPTLGPSGPTSARTAGAIIFSGRSDFTVEDSPGGPEPQIERYLGGTLAQIPLKYNAASPIKSVTFDDGAVVIFHGKTDTVVPYQKQAVPYRDKLNQIGVPNLFEGFTGIGHNLGFNITYNGTARNLLLEAVQYLDSQQWPRPDLDMATIFSTPIDVLKTTLASPYTQGDTSITLASGTGVRFGTPSAAAPVRFTIRAKNFLDSLGELTDTSKYSTFKCTGRSTDTLTGVTFSGPNGNEQNFIAGDEVGVLVTKDSFMDIHTAVNAIEAAKVITTAATTAFDSPVNLGALPSGILKTSVANNVATISTAIQGSDYYAPGGNDVSIPDGGLGIGTAPTLGQFPIGTAGGIYALGSIATGVFGSTTVSLSNNVYTITSSGGGGGGGFPGGNSGEINYNSSGAFAGAANSEISINGNIVLVSQAEPGTISVGELWVNSTYGILRQQIVGPITTWIPGYFYTQRTSVVIANTNALESIINATSAIGTPTVPSQAWIVGREIEIEFSGKYSTAGTAPTMAVQLRVDSSSGTSLGTSGAISCDASVTDKTIEGKFSIRCIASGAGGQLRVYGIHSRTRSSDTRNNSGSIDGTLTSVDLSVNRTLVPCIVWNNASSSNTCTIDRVVMRIVA